MTSLKRHQSNNKIALLLMAACPGLAWGAASQGVTLNITKSLSCVPGQANATSPSYSLGSAVGEPIGGHVESSTDYVLISGYYGGRFGAGQTFQMLSSQVGATGNKTFFQDGLQVGVPLNAPITLNFSDQLQLSYLPNGISIRRIVDHLGNVLTDATENFSTRSNPTGTQLILTPQTAWQGNTLYDLILTPDLISFDGFPLNTETHVQFMTVLDPHQENRISEPISSIGSVANAPGASNNGSLNIDIPSNALTDFSTVLISHDPLTSPLRIDPNILKTANAKAAAAGGPYRVPLALTEIAAYDTQGNGFGTISLPATLTLSYSASQGIVANVVPIRTETLSLWVLDEPHQLWVKVPGSLNNQAAQSVGAAFNRFSVFALMGAPDNSASDAFVFPVPWRPHGPNSGTGAGQTGTETDGMTFSFLPSECTIRIYTLSGELVREIHHSDASGILAQEKWDGKTPGGDAVASGVYLWRVESATAGKNGKLMIIR